MALKWFMTEKISFSRWKTIPGFKSFKVVTPFHGSTYKSSFNSVILHQKVSSCLENIDPETSVKKMDLMIVILKSRTPPCVLSHWIGETSVTFYVLFVSLP